MCVGAVLPRVQANEKHCLDWCCLKSPDDTGRTIAHHDFEIFSVEVFAAKCISLIEGASRDARWPGPYGGRSYECDALHVFAQFLDMSSIDASENGHTAPAEFLDVQTPFKA